ncbi:unnamed protein product [Clonostachys solani]|uniref:FAD/NAD(P)-binding domain-containing protein n=1 Tax=Clonostachys solani TaxID=160281 RepID=A0A9P0EJF9_9HYPO|nr:unnamed protein product [Clonostachys solani]
MVANSDRVPFHLESPKETSRSEARYHPEDKPWNQYRDVKVIVVGSGISGISAAVLLSHKVPNAKITVYEKFSKVGGTWAANVYPGVRCDVPSHVYQLSFETNANWSEYYPKGAEIQQYYERVLEKHGLTENVKTEHQVVRATWLKDASKWAVEVRELQSGNVFVDTADFLVNAQGRISDPNYPDIPGLRDIYQGSVIHTARWPSQIDIAGKKVAIIGNGASGQQLLPNIAPVVEKIDHYVRNKTWVTPTFVRDLHQATKDAPGGPVYSEEQQTRFREDPSVLLEHRRELESKFHHPPGGDRLDSEKNNALREKIIEVMRERLDGDEEWLQRVLPDYAPGCKRLTPAPGYLETVKSDKVEYITEGIKAFTPKGILAADGTERQVDIVILATGFEPSFNSRFPVIGTDGTDLRDKWSINGPIGYPETYLGIMAPGYPNYFFVLQAQGNARGGSVPLQTELSATYIARAIRKVQSQSYSSLDPREEAAQEFNDICAAAFENSVLTDKCNSWFKQGKGATRVVISWPGTFHHRAQALREPRWEDFNFARRHGAEKNRFEYFGDGSTAFENSGNPEDLIRYVIDSSKVDIATLHETWTE